ncbi:MAG: histidine phosphatase family protein [bacterium]
MIYLARHGRSKYNNEELLNGQFDDPLIEQGEKEAEILAKKARMLRIEEIYSSQLIRAFVTARIVATTLGISKITSLKGLNERDFGKLTHQPVSKIIELSDVVLRANENSIFCLSGLGVETFPKLIQRLKPIYHELVKWRYSKESILVVSHGDVMKALETIHRDVDYQQVLMEGHYPNCHIVHLK